MSDTPPNIVLVSVDSLRADRCGCLGAEPTRTPTLDRLASTGTVFEHAIAPGPSTPESMPAIFTGQYPHPVSEIDAEGLEGRRSRIRQHMHTVQSLPERLARLGYTTAGFTPNPFTSRYFGFDRGFDHFEDFMGEARPLGRAYDRLFRRFLRGESVSSMGRILLNLWQGEEVFKPWEGFVDEVLDWQQHAPEPYFLWVFLMDAHNPYLSRPPYRTQPRWKQFHANYRFWRESHDTPFTPAVHDRLVTAYDDAVRYADAFLDRLTVALDDPLIVVHGDHGEAFGEHGTYGHEPYLFEENIHVPLVIANGPATRVRGPTSLRWVPDLLVGTARTGSLDPADAVVCHARTESGGRRAVRGRQWKYIRDDDRGEVYRLAPTEEAIAADGLSTLGESLVAGEAEADLERRRIIEGVSAVDGGRA